MRIYGAFSKERAPFFDAQGNVQPAVEKQLRQHFKQHEEATALFEIDPERYPIKGDVLRPPFQATATLLPLEAIITHDRELLTGPRVELHMWPGIEGPHEARFKIGKLATRMAKLGVDESIFSQVTVTSYSKLVHLAERVIGMEPALATIYPDNDEALGRQRRVAVYRAGPGIHDIDGLDLSDIASATMRTEAFLDRWAEK